jgi:hypothetical protein
VTVAQTEFQLRVTNTPRDFQRFQTAYQLQRSGGFLRFVAAMVYMLMLAVIFLPASIVAKFLTEKLLVEIPDSMEWLWIIVAGALPMFYIYAKTATWVLSLFWKTDLGSFTLPTSFSIGSEGVRTESETGHSLVRWRGIKEVIAASDTFYLDLGGNAAIVIPKRAFSSADDAADFLSFARQQIAAHEGTPGVFA